LRFSELTVAEGQSANISDSNLDVVWMPEQNQRKLRNDNALSFFTLKLVSLPKHGSLTRMGKAVNVGDTYAFQQLKKNNLLYSHDGSESAADQIVFLVGTEGLDSFIRSTVGATFLPFVVLLTFKQNYQTL